MSHVELAGVVKRFGTFEAIRGIDLAMPDGAFTVFVGPSGCGKSTLLRLICGLEVPSEGVIRFDGRDMRGIPPAGRKLAMVFQSYALYPHMSVADNMGFALRMAGVSRSERAVRVKKAAETLQITRLLDRRPRELSGGQRQRVAIGRAIVREPSLFLFDEPLSNLDAELRVEMRFELAELHRRLGASMIYVTHDQVEAMTLADRIVVMHDGEIEQIGTPADLYEQPANRFVANFIGSPRMNFLKGKVVALRMGAVDIAIPRLDPEHLTLPLKDNESLKVGDEVEVGIRPDDLLLGAGGEARMICNVDFSEYVGGATYLHSTSHPAGRLTIRSSGGAVPFRGEVSIGVVRAKCHVFHASGERLSPQ
jgi:ABC-type sugar transport system ATPase subunit